MFPSVQIHWEFLLKSFHVFQIFFKGSILYITNLTFTKTSLLDKAFHICRSLRDHPLSECAHMSPIAIYKVSECSGYWEESLIYDGYPERNFLMLILLTGFLPYGFCHTTKDDSWKRGLICNVSIIYVAWYLVKV